MGWYSTGPRLREADLQITDLMTEYVDNPILVICEVQVSTCNMQVWLCSYGKQCCASLPTLPD